MAPPTRAIINSATVKGSKNDDMATLEGEAQRVLQYTAPMVSAKRNDPVRSFVAELLHGRIGPPFNNQKELDAVYVEGAARYALKRPPGFADVGKDGSYVAGITCRPRSLHIKTRDLCRRLVQQQEVAA